MKSFRVRFLEVLGCSRLAVAAAQCPIGICAAPCAEFHSRACCHTPGAGAAPAQSGPYLRAGACGKGRAGRAAPGQGEKERCDSFSEPDSLLCSSLPTPGRERPAIPPRLAQLPHPPSGPCCGWRAGERREDTFPNHFKPRKTPPVLTSHPLHPGKGFRAVPPFPGKPLARGGVGVPGCHRGAPVAAA